MLSWLLVVTSSPGWGTASSVTLYSPGVCGMYCEVDGHHLSVGGGLDLLLGRRPPSCPATVSNEQPHGDLAVDVAVDADLAGDGQLVLHEHVLVDQQILDGDVLGRAQPRDWPKTTVNSGSPWCFK